VTSEITSTLAAQFPLAEYQKTLQETGENYSELAPLLRALALMLYTAQRRGDVIRMGWQHVKGDTITVKQQKTGIVLDIPMHCSRRWRRCRELI
jgi:integrase